MNIKFNLKEPNKSESLILMFCRWNGNLIKLSTRHRVQCNTWNKEKQRCSISKLRFSDRTNRNGERTNKFLYDLMESINSYFDSSGYDESTTSPLSVKQSLEHKIDSLMELEKSNEEKLHQTPIEFFKKYVEQKRIDPHTGRYINERTKIHQRTVIHRLESFLLDTKLPNDFTTFTSKKFDAQFSEWCYSIKNYKQNTIYATYGVLKPLLNAAKEEGYSFSDSYKLLKGNATMWITPFCTPTYICCFQKFFVLSGHHKQNIRAMYKDRNYPDELTAKMYSQFRVSRDIEIKHKSCCVWKSVSPNASREEFEKEAVWYGITYEGVMKHGHKWLTAIHNSEDEYAK